MLVAIISLSCILVLSLTAMSLSPAYEQTRWTFGSNLSHDIYDHLPTVSDIQFLCRTVKKGNQGGTDGIPPTYCITLAHGSCTSYMHLLSRCLLQKRSRFNGEAVSLFRFGSDVESKTTSRTTGRYGLPTFSARSFTDFWYRGCPYLPAAFYETGSSVE